MTRASKEWVDECLAAIESDADKLPPGCSVLAAEVRALRDRAAKLEAEVMALREDLSRVEVLPDAWRVAARLVNDPTSPSIFVECAEDLERVLNDDYHAEVDKLRGDEQDAWARLGAELCEAETERDKLRQFILAYRQAFEDHDAEAYDADVCDARAALFRLLR